MTIETRDRKAQRLIKYEEAGWEEHPWVIDYLSRNPPEEDKPKGRPKKSTEEA